MAFEGLSEKLNATFKHLRGKGRLSEEDIKLAMREVRLALLEADVSYKVVKDFVKTVSERAVGAEVLDSLTPAQQVIKIVSEELTALMGGANAKLTFASRPPTVVMMVGLQGAGKTTNVAKLAGYFRKQGHRPLLTACDVYRPAAITQLQVVGKQLNIPVFEMGQIDPVQIAQEAVKYAGDHGNDMVFLDTAGRLHIDEALMDELKRIKAAVKPTEILLVVDAMTGQDAVNAATAFDEALGIDGVVLTKLDGDARGGAALSIRAATGKGKPTIWRWQARYMQDGADGLFQRTHHVLDGRGLLADRHVNAGHALALLGNDGVDGYGGLAGLAVANDQFALTTANGHHGVDGLHAGL